MVVGDALGAVPGDVQLVVLGLLIGTAIWAAVRCTPSAVVAFVACAAMWSRANQAWEGSVLWTLTPEHGITTADLWPPLLAVPIGWRLVRGRRLGSGGAEVTSEVVAG